MVIKTFQNLEISNSSNFEICNTTANGVATVAHDVYQAHVPCHLFLARPLPAAPSLDTASGFPSSTNNWALFHFHVPR